MVGLGPLISERWIRLNPPLNQSLFVRHFLVRYTLKNIRMSACHDLFKTYEEWRDWSVREGNAIRSADWSQVNSCQRAKMELQGRIIQYTQTARNHLTATGGNWPEVEQRLRSEVASLIDLENRNGETLAQVRCQALAEEAELDRSSRQLRQVRSYAPVVRSAWTSYS